MRLKDFRRIYPLKRLWRMFFLAFSHLPMLPNWRAKVLKMGGVDVKGRSWIYSDVTVDSVAPERIHIGERVTITVGTKILTHYLDVSKPGRHFNIGDVVIGNDVFIGAGVIICNSVTIGDGAVIGAGSIVTKDIPPYEVWAGNPARYIKMRAK